MDDIMNYGMGGGGGGGIGVGERIRQAAALKRQMEAQKYMLVDGLGYDEDEVDQMSPGEVMGHLQGAQLSSQMNTQQQSRDLNQAHLQDYLAQAQLRQAQVQDNLTNGTLLQNYFNAPKVPKPGVDVSQYGQEGVPDDMLTAPAPMDALRYAFNKTPNASSRHLPQLLDSIGKIWQSNQAAAGEDVLKPAIDSTSIPGNALVTYGKSMQVVPTGGTQVQALDLGGPTPDRVIIGPRGQMQQVKGSKLSARAVPVKDAFGQPTGEMQMEINGEPDDVQTWLNKNKGGKAGAPADNAQIPADHIDYLKSHPDTATRASFDAKYGKGSAAKQLK